MDRDKKVLFVTLLGQATFAKLKDLANAWKIRDISLNEIVDLLIEHYCPKTIEIANKQIDCKWQCPSNCQNYMFSPNRSAIYSFLPFILLKNLNH